MKAPKKLTRGEQEARGDLRTKWLAPDQEWLELHYLVLGKSANQIALEVGAGDSGEIVKRWLEIAGLEVRRYRHPSPTRGWLEYHYTTLGKVTDTIGLEVGVDGGTVRKWLYDADIPIRSSGLQKGERHYRWLGGSSLSAQKESLLRSETPFRCDWCGMEECFSLGHKGVLQLHHKDHEHSNWSLENLCWMCYTCHQLETRLWYAEKEDKICLEWISDQQLLITLRKLNL